MGPLQPPSGAGPPTGRSVSNVGRPAAWRAFAGIRGDDAIGLCRAAATAVEARLPYARLEDGRRGHEDLVRVAVDDHQSYGGGGEHILRRPDAGGARRHRVVDIVLTVIVRGGIGNVEEDVAAAVGLLNELGARAGDPRRDLAPGEAAGTDAEGGIGRLRVAGTEARAALELQGVADRIRAIRVAAVRVGRLAGEGTRSAARPLRIRRQRRDGEYRRRQERGDDRGDDREEKCSV